MHYTTWQLTAADKLDLKATRILTYDSEFVRERNYYPKLSLVQLKQPGWQRAKLVDMQQQGHEVLWQQIADLDAPLVVHAASQDLELMYAESGKLPRTLRDTQIGFALCRPQKNVSYAELIHAYLDIDIDKSETRSDWLARPLTDEQLNYAADDVGPLTTVYPLLCAELARLGRLAWWAEECERLLAAEAEPKAPYHWFRLRGAPQKIRKQQQNAAEALTQLREAVAAEADLPRRKILSDEKLISIALKNPASIADVKALLGADHALFTNPSFADDLFSKVLAEVPPVKARAPKVSAAKKKLLDDASEFVLNTAHELNIEPDMLASPRQLRQWINSDFSETLLASGWRSEIFSAFRG